VSDGGSIFKKTPARRRIREVLLADRTRKPLDELGALPVLLKEREPRAKPKKRRYKSALADIEKDDRIIADLPRQLETVRVEYDRAQMLHIGRI
jgi:hypothetical protein